MDTSTKNRLVGAMALLALGIIFLPSLFYREPVSRVVVDTTTQIPPRPAIEPVVVAPQPAPPPVVSAPSPTEIFQPALDERSEEKGSQNKTAADQNDLSKKPNLSDKGLPNAWVIQVGSFSSLPRANELVEKLQKQNYKSYQRSVKTSKGQYYRVFVGPFIDKSRASLKKKQIDKAYQVKSQLLKFSAE